jgi:hypothetical protein
MNAIRASSKPNQIATHTYKKARQQNLTSEEPGTPEETGRESDQDEPQRRFRSDVKPIKCAAGGTCCKTEQSVGGRRKTHKAPRRCSLGWSGNKLGINVDCLKSLICIQLALTSYSADRVIFGLTLVPEWNPEKVSCR